jgi:hypothetical protein
VLRISTLWYVEWKRHRDTTTRRAASPNTSAFVRRLRNKHVTRQYKNCWKRCFVCGPSRGSITRAGCRYEFNCKQQTRYVVRESAPHQQTRNCLTVINIWSWAPDGCLTRRQTGRLTVDLNITLTLSCYETVYRSWSDVRQPARTWAWDQSNTHCWKPLPSSAVKAGTENTSLCVTMICKV